VAMEVYGFDGELVELTIVFDDAGGDFDFQVEEPGAAAPQKPGFDAVESPLSSASSSSDDAERAAAAPDDAPADAPADDAPAAPAAADAADDADAAAAAAAAAPAAPPEEPAPAAGAAPEEPPRGSPGKGRGGSVSSENTFASARTEAVSRRGSARESSVASDAGAAPEVEDTQRPKSPPPVADAPSPPVEDVASPAPPPPDQSESPEKDGAFSETEAENRRAREERAKKGPSPDKGRRRSSIKRRASDGHVIMPEHIDVDSSFEPPVVPKSVESRALILQALQTNMLFAELAKGQLEIIISAMAQHHVARGEVLIRQGDVGDAFYTVEEGAFDIFVKMRNNKSGHGKKVATAGAGTSFAGQQKRAKFPTSKAHISAVFHSLRLIFGRAIISRNGLEA